MTGSGDPRHAVGSWQRAAWATLPTLPTLAAKDLKLLFRDHFALFFVFAFPLLYCLFFGTIFAGEHGPGGRTHAPIRIVVVDQDGSDASRRLLDRLAEHPSLQLVTPAVSDVEAADERVRKGDCAASIRIPAGYGDSPFWLFDVDAAAAPGMGRFDIGIDPTRRAEAGFLQGVLLQSLIACLAERIGDRELMRRELQRARTALRATEDVDSGQRLALAAVLAALDRLLVEADPAALAQVPKLMAPGDRLQLRDVSQSTAAPRSSFEVTFPSAMIWGLMSVALSFAIMLVRERKQGTLLRLRSAPIGTAQLLAGKALGCFLACVLSIGFLLLFGRFVLDVRVADVAFALLAIGCTSLCFTGLMMAAAVVGRSEQAVMGAAWGVMLPLAMVGGGMIPLVAMPPWLLALSDVSPFKWGIYAMEGAVWRGFTAVDMALPCVVLVATGGLCFGFGVVVFRRAHW
jgi:ABC-2 type transport system permease protein